LYDTTNSAVILSATNLSGSNTNGTFSYDFLAPAGCNNVNVVMYRELSTATDYVMNSWSLKPLTPQATLTCTWKPMFDSGDLASGTDKISGWNLTSGWTATADCTINDLNTFTTTVANRGVYKTTILTVGKQYEIHIVGSTTAASGMSVRNDIGTTGQSIVGVGGTSFDSTFRVSWSQGTGPFLQNLSAGTTDITTFSITEISTDTILTAGDMSLKYIAGLDQLEFSDGTNTAVKSLTCVAETAYAITAKWDGVNSLMKIAVDGVYGTETAFTGSFNPASDPYLRPLVSPQFQWLNDVDIMKEMTW
jgi:hypothetical protein